MGLITSVIPVLGFLGVLYLFDSFKLVRHNLLWLCILWGLSSAILAYVINSGLWAYIVEDRIWFTRYMAPLIEEVLKGLIILTLIQKRRIGFSIDAAIYGFAVGAGFSIIENMVYYFQLGSDYGFLVFLLRGLGTAVMHGGCTALLAVWMISTVSRGLRFLPMAIIGTLCVIVLHSTFNHFFLNPILQTAITIAVFPLIFVILFNYSNARLHAWLELEFSDEVEMLQMMSRGKVMETRAGQFLTSFKQHFPAEVVVDMYCYLSIYLELSIKAKRNIMLRESGFGVIIEPDIDNKLIELNQLRKQIGKAGELAIRPLIRMSYRELWKLNQLQTKTKQTML